MTTLCWSLLAWCALALAMPRHHEQVFGREGAAWMRRCWRCAGVAAVLMVLAQAVHSEGWALGCLYAVAALAVVGVAVPVAIAWAPRHCVALAALAAPLGAWLAL
ncbi:MAG: DUF3325 domain-containing protein [Rhodoferax sp.]